MTCRAKFRRATVPQQRTRAWRLTVLLPSLLFALVAIPVFAIVGCKTNSHTSDSRLQKIDELLNAKLPKGTPMSRVTYFLTSRGYTIEDSPDKNSVVAIVRHVDTDTLQPSTAIVTFHFDANNNLTSYELQPATDATPHP